MKNLGCKSALKGIDTEFSFLLSTMFSKINAVVGWSCLPPRCTRWWKDGELGNLSAFWHCAKFLSCYNLLLSVVVLSKCFVVLATLLEKLLGERVLYISFWKLKVYKQKKLPGCINIPTYGHSFKETTQNLIKRKKPVWIGNLRQPLRLATYDSILHFYLSNHIIFFINTGDTETLHICGINKIS